MNSGDPIFLTVYFRHRSEPDDRHHQYMSDRVGSSEILDIISIRCPTGVADPGPGPVPSLLQTSSLPKVLSSESEPNLHLMTLLESEEEVLPDLDSVYQALPAAASSHSRSRSSLPGFAFNR